MKKDGRKKRKKRLRLLPVFFTILVIAGVILSMTVFFKITEVRIEGDLRRHTEQEILITCGIDSGNNIFLLNIGKIERGVWENLLYIDEVHISRHLPGTVVISVVEINDLFAIEQDNAFLILSKNLKILDRPLTLPDEICVITGLDAINPVVGSTLEPLHPERAEYLRELFASLETYAILHDITAIDVSDKLNYTLIFDDRIAVVLGTANNLDYKINMMAEVILEKLDLQDTGSLDVSTAGKSTFKRGDFHTQSESDEQGIVPDVTDEQGIVPDDTEETNPDDLVQDPPDTDATVVFHSAMIRKIDLLFWYREKNTCLMA